MQALIPAAGMGKRLGKNLENKPKCMVEIGNLSLIERAVVSLKKAGIQRLVIIAGYQIDLLKAFVREFVTDIDTYIIDNPLYETTNNIYTIYLARHEMVKEDTILLESDLIFDTDLISLICQSTDDNVAVVDKYDPVWMDGTVVSINQGNIISAFISKKDIHPEHIEYYYKTVNIYKFSKEFTRDLFVPALSGDVEGGNVNQYYETVLGRITDHVGPCLKAFLMNGRKWYEIDNEADLNKAKLLFE